MKRTVLVCVALLMAAPLVLRAEKKQMSDGLYWELNGTTLTISGNGPMKDKYNSRYKATEKLIIEEGVTSIPDYAFDKSYFPNLTFVSIPNSVMSIGNGVFGDCQKLTTVSIGNSVTSIGERAFFGCTSLTSISIPNSVTSIGNLAFCKCDNLTSILSLPISIIEGGESEWNRIRLPKEAIYKYILAHRDEERFRPFAIVADIKTKGGYGSVKLIKDGNADYYIVCKDSRYGLMDASGQVIVPAELNDIAQCGTGFLRFKVGSYWGVMNYAGKIIIPTDRGYTKIGDYVSFTKRFPYEMDGYKGECNNLGQQVSKIKVATAQKNVASSGSTSAASASSSSSSGSSKSGSTTQTVVVEHHRDPIPVQEWQQCNVCLGDGKCHVCYGSGTNWNGNKCITCNWSGKCTYCNGQGGRYQTVYR